MNNTEDKPIPQQYWYYTYQWKQFNGTWQLSDNVFRGSFIELIAETKKQPELWVIMYAKEISVGEYNFLISEVG